MSHVPCKDSGILFNMQKSYNFIGELMDFTSINADHTVKILNFLSSLLYLEQKLLYVVPKKSYCTFVFELGAAEPGILPT